MAPTVVDETQLATNWRPDLTEIEPPLLCAAAVRIAADAVTEFSPN